MKVRHGVAVALLGLVLVGCGVQPTGIIGAGEPASGLTRGMRLYYASDSGLRGVPLLDRRLQDLNSVVKLLAQGPGPAEQRDGLTSLVQELGGYTVSGSGARVTIHMEGAYPLSGRDQGTGQLVCTLARAQSGRVPEVEAGGVGGSGGARGGAVEGPLRGAGLR
ncbi:hypothetical protein ACFW96_29185, partial [Streptomyces gardneri]|uniref:hypothetical protein n=1 Tax=Streptomyces gardneri TaxID=66892 RepID=UPI0036C98F2B